MHKSGPPKKPTNLKLLQGTFRPWREVENEPIPENAIPPVPEFLSDDAKAEWGRISAELYQLGLLSRIDRAALTGYCEAWSDFQEASLKCRTEDGKDRKVLRSEKGNPYENPYYTIKKRSMELMHKFLTEFGMTPASRTRINAPAPEQQSSGNRFANIGKNG